MYTPLSKKLELKEPYRINKEPHASEKYWLPEIRFPPPMVLMYGGSSKIFVLLLLMTLLMRFWKRNDTIWKLRTSKLVRKTLTEKNRSWNFEQPSWTWFILYSTLLYLEWTMSGSLINTETVFLVRNLSIFRKILKQ